MYKMLQMCVYVCVFCSDYVISTILAGLMTMVGASDIVI
jgi:hypothetical protein